MSYGYISNYTAVQIGPALVVKNLSPHPPTRWAQSHTPGIVATPGYHNATGMRDAFLHLGTLCNSFPLLGVIYKWRIYGLVFSGCANLHSKNDSVSSLLLDTTKCQSTSHCQHGRIVQLQNEDENSANDFM